MVKKFIWTVADSNTISSGNNTVMNFASTGGYANYYTSTDGFLTSDDDIEIEEPGLFDPLVDLVNKVVECRYCATTYVVPEAGKVECPGCGANAREKAVAKV